MASMLHMLFNVKNRVDFRLHSKHGRAFHLFFDGITVTFIYLQWVCITCYIAHLLATRKRKSRISLAILHISIFFHNFIYFSIASFTMVFALNDLEKIYHDKQWLCLNVDLRLALHNKHNNNPSKQTRMTSKCVKVRSRLFTFSRKYFNVFIIHVINYGGIKIYTSFCVPKVIRIRVIRYLP